MTAHVSNKRLIAALRKNAGVVSLAAQSLGLTREAVSKRLRNSPDLQKAVDEIEDVTLDLAEGVIVTALQAKDPTTARWYLDRKGRKRGYASNVDLRLPEDQLRRIIGAMTDEEVDRLAE